MRRELDINYYAEVGIVDFFNLTMTKNEILKKLASGDSGFNANEQMEVIEKGIIDLIYKNTGEHPHTIRYFVMPDVDYGDFQVCIIAKIINNGSTFVFSPKREWLKCLGEPYDPDIYKINKE